MKRIGAATFITANASRKNKDKEDAQAHQGMPMESPRHVRYES